MSFFIKNQQFKRQNLGISAFLKVLFLPHFNLKKSHNYEENNCFFNRFKKSIWNLVSLRKK